MEQITVGIYIFVVGMVVLFFSLGALSLLIMLLERVFRAKPVVTTVESVSPVDGDDGTNSEQMQEMAVAMAVAICLLEHQEQEYDPSLGELLEMPHGHWWHGRALQAGPVFKK